MWKVLFFLNFGAFQCAVSTSLPIPTNVIFSSVNLRNVLEWTPGKDTPGNETFTVQYAIYGDSVVSDKRSHVRWRAVQRCTEVAQSWCDLSNETWDLDREYYARVRAVSRKASSKWALTQRFDPKLDTNFGPPMVIIEVENNSAIVTVKGPMRYQPNSQMPVVSMETIYPEMMYNLSINNTCRRKTNHFTIRPGPHEHRLTDYNAEYCFSAKAKFLAMPAQTQSSEWQCITTPPDPVASQLQWVVVSIVVPFLSVCLILVIGYILYQYLMGIGQETPYLLDPAFFNQSSMMFHPEKTKINVITPIKRAGPGSDPYFEDPPPQYFFYMLQEPAYISDDLDTSYGFVCSTSASGREESKIGHVSGEDEKDLKPKENLVSGVYAPQDQNHFSGVYAPQAQRPFNTHRHAPGQVARFHTPANLKGEILKEDGVAAPGLEEQNGKELEPLLSGYAAQNLRCTFAEQTDLRLAGDEGALGLDETEQDGGGHAEEEEQERGTILIDWDPKVGKLVLPELTKLIDRGNGPGNGGEPSKEEEEEGEVVRGDLLLGDAFVRQTSEEEVQTPREPERDPEGEEVHDILTKWNLVIPMDD